MHERRCFRPAKAEVTARDDCITSIIAESIGMLSGLISRMEKGFDSHSATTFGGTLATSWSGPKPDHTAQLDRIEAKLNWIHHYLRYKQEFEVVPTKDGALVIEGPKWPLDVGKPTVTP